MKKILTLILFSLFFLMNCMDSSLDALAVIDPEENQSNKTICSSNNSSEECMLLLTDIDFNLPEESCSAYDLVVHLESDFLAPAGIGYGTTSRVDWEFYPHGNAGFWVEPVQQNKVIHSGKVDVYGCFSFGAQDTLKITHTLTDEYGNNSNSLTVEVPRSSAKVKASGNTEGFVILNK